MKTVCNSTIWRLKCQFVESQKGAKMYLKKNPFFSLSLAISHVSGSLWCVLKVKSWLSQRYNKRMNWLVLQIGALNMIPYGAELFFFCSLLSAFFMIFYIFYEGLATNFSNLLLLPVSSVKALTNTWHNHIFLISTNAHRCWCKNRKIK